MQRFVRISLVVIALMWAASVDAAQDPLGVWNLKVRVGNVGQGLRTVLLKVEKDADGGLKGTISDLRNDMRPTEKLTFEKDVLTVEYGAYTYVLKVVGDTVTGTVANPTGTQNITGERQATTLYFGDKVAPLQKEWSGILGPRTAAPPPGEKNTESWAKPLVSGPGDVVLWSRRVKVEFTNAAAHEAALMELVGKNVVIAGTWRTDKLEIDTIKAVPPRRQ